MRRNPGKAFFLTAAVVLALAIHSPAQTPADTAAVPWYFAALGLPTAPLPADGAPVLIAVVDDGFRLDHRLQRDFWYRAPEERPGNGLDDDGNGYADDVTGWDVSDGDPDVSPPAGREVTFYHGSFVSGAIADLLRQAYGPAASRLFRILPVKALSDRAQQTYLRDGYRGVAYALSRRPDILVCAWNGGRAGPEEAALFAEARRMGITVVASAGNFFAERAEPPAALPAVVAVAAVDEGGRRTAESNFGMFVDLAGPGSRVRGADARDPHAWRYEGATSAAAATVAACFAILKQRAPTATPADLLAALRNTATPLDDRNPRYAGKLGSGLPHLTRALAFLTAPHACCRTHNPDLPAGVLSERLLPPRPKDHSWTIAPAGAFRGIRFEWTAPEKRTSATLQFLDANQNLVTEHPLAEAGQVLVPGSRATVRYRQRRAAPPVPFSLSYRAETTDSTTLFCRDVQYLENPDGVIRDGSGGENYANGCDCRWQITLPPGKRVRLRFSEFDTQAKVDFVYLFDGRAAIPENIIAKFSGPDIPPEMISRTNEVLIWFVTDSDGAGRGWTLEYEGY